MSMLDYCFYSVLGILIVFAVLALLMLIIKIFMSVTSKKEEPVVAAAASDGAASAVEVKLAPGTAGDVKLYDTNPRDAAMIMAIVADELGKPLNELRFISIREVDR